MDPARSAGRRQSNWSQTGRTRGPLAWDVADAIDATWCADRERTTLKQVYERSSMSFGTLLIVGAGAYLVLMGILCLCLSGVVVTGWWQGTLDGFGVGFVVGGLVDVLAIFGLNQVINVEGRRTPEYNKRAREILQALATERDVGPDARERLERAYEADALLKESWDGALIDRRLRIELQNLVEAESTNMSSISRIPEGQDHGDAPKAPGTR
jgi:hypothetical protein